jgi:hypothetical protein
MIACFRSLRGRAASALVLLGVLSRPAAAQLPFTMAEAPATPQFLSRFDFHMAAARLSDTDPRFSWDTHWAGDFDVVDYVHGRISFLADYEALLGSEFRPFDPYQSNYTLEAMGSIRAGKTEFVGVLNHLSRHLGDRYKRIAIAENSLGVRVMRQITRQSSTVELRGDVRKVTARAYLDYTWYVNGDVTVRRTVSPRVDVYARGFGQVITVDRTVIGRDAQGGGRAEAGVQVSGTGGRLQVFGGFERMTDADQLDRLPRQWAFAGFRLLGR